MSESGTTLPRGPRAPGLPRPGAFAVPPASGAGRHARESIGTWRALVRSFAALAVGDVAARLPGIAAILLLARRLEPGGFGMAMIGVTLIFWFSLVVDAGTETISTRDISRRPERLREIADPVLGLRLALSVGAMALLGVATWVAADGADRTLLLLFTLVLPASALNLRTMVLGVGARTAVGLGNVFSQLLFLAGVAALVRGAHDVRWVPVLKAAGELGNAAVILAALRPRFGLVRPRLDLGAWRAMLRDSLPLFGNGLARAVMFSSSVFLVGSLLGRQDVGLYSAAHRPVVFAAGVTGLLLVSFLASYSAAGPADSARMFHRTVWVGAATIPLALAVSAASGPLVRLVYGPSYTPAAPTLALLVWVVPVLLIGGPYGLVLIAANHQGTLLRNNVLGAVFTLVGTLTAVPAVGIVGAAAVAVAAQTLVAVLNYRTSVGRGLAPRLGAVLHALPGAIRNP